MKSPPVQHPDDGAATLVEQFIQKYGPKAPKKARERTAAEA